MLFSFRVVFGSAASALLACSLWAGSARADGRAARIQKGPYLTGLSDTGVTVRFELDAASSVAVRVVRDDGKEPAVPLLIPSREPSAMRLVRIAGLEPETRYAYVVQAAGTSLGAGHFTTAKAPAAGSSVTFLVYGDNRTGDAAHAAIVRAMQQVPSDFLVHTGDAVAEGGSDADWQGFFDIERPLLRDRPLVAAIGNHELVGDRAGAAFARYFGSSDPAIAGGVPRPYGTVRAGNVRFFTLSGMHAWDAGEEREWLERELARADAEAGLVWRVVVLHQSAWSAGPHGPDRALVAAHVPELLAAHKVDLILAGHDHLYERGEERGGGRLKYVISGGGGAPLYPVQPVSTTRKAESAYHFVQVTTTADDVRIVALRVDGSVLDRCGFKKGTSWDCDPVAPSTPTPVPALAATASTAPRPESTARSASGGCSAGATARGTGIGGPWTGAGGLALGLACALIARRARRVTRGKG